MKPVLNKIIHTDQKGFVAGRNISENNRMIDDIMQQDILVWLNAILRKILI
jgi:hypothetical protein